MMPEILLTPRELLYIAALLDVPEFIGLSDAFFGMDETEMRREMMDLQESLTQKGYAEMDFDGGFILKDEVRDTVDICAACDTLIVVDKNKVMAPQLREFYYSKNGRIIKMDENEGLRALTPVSDIDVLLGFIMRGIEWQTKGSFLKNIRISNSVLSNVSDQLREADGAAGEKILLGNGCDEISSKAIMEGLSGRANYYATAVTVFEGANEGAKNVMLIDSQNGIYRLTPIADGDEGTETVQFDALTIEQAEMVLAELIRNSLLGRSEV